MGDKTAIEWTDADMLARWFAESVERCAYFKGVDPFHTPLGSYQSWDWPQREMITEIMHDLLRIAFEAPQKVKPHPS